MDLAEWMISSTENKICRGNYCIEYTRREYTRSFVLKYFDVLKELGIRYVLNHLRDYPVDSIKNALLVYSTIITNARKTPRIEKRVYIFRPFSSIADTYYASLYRRYCDVLLYFDDGGLLLCYNTDDNVFITTDITHYPPYEYQFYDRIYVETVLYLMKLAKQLALDESLFEEITLNSFADLVLRYPIEIATVIPINSMICRINNIDIEIGNGIKVCLAKPIAIESNRYIASTTNMIIELDKSFIIRINDLCIEFNNEGHFIAINGDIEVTIDDTSFRHPNVNDDGTVCLGTYSVQPLKLNEEICEQVSKIVNDIIQLLSMPSTNAYNGELFREIEWLIETGKLKEVRRIPLTW